jgi:hypothetical protein
MTPQEMQTHRDRELIFLREHEAAARAFIATGKGFDLAKPALIRMNPSTGSDNGDGSKA